MTKAARVLCLWWLFEAGVVSRENTLQEIADLFGVHRSTILRDLRVFEAAEREYRAILERRRKGL